jgi:rod shape-determining protein MreC
MENPESIRFFKQGYRASTRLVFFVSLSLLLMFVDARYRYMESARSLISVLVYPVQQLALLPSRVLQGASDFLSAQSGLVADNARLRQWREQDALQMQRLKALQAENAELRALLALRQGERQDVVLAGIVYAERDVFRRRVVLDKGAQAGIEPGRVVVDAVGVVGQVTRVYPFLSEVTLVTDKDQSVPVQVLRNGYRTVAFGSGDTSQLSLRYTPVSADIKEGDELVTSGIDGIYPAGLPVARVARIERDPAYPFARILCQPIAGVDHHRHLMILSALASQPPRPEPEAAPGVKGKVKR